jgi:hypothetical protein
MWSVFPSAIIGYHIRAGKEKIVVMRFAYTPPCSVRHARVRREILRKRIFAVFVAVLCALMLSMYFYYRSAYLRNAGDWRWFWVGEVMVGVWLIFALAQVLTNTPKLSVTEDHIAAHKWSIGNSSDVKKSDLCGCFYCLEVFPPNEIQDWTDDGDTALCPKCGIASVIASFSEYPIQREFLSKMHDHWF